MEPENNDSSPEQAAEVPASEKPEGKPERFQCYVVNWGVTAEDPFIEELVWIGRGTPEQKRVLFSTSIRLPKELWDRLRPKDAGALQNEIMEFASALGKELVKTTRVRFSCPPNTDGADGVRATFQYKLRGQKLTEEIDVATIPADVIEAVRTIDEYQKDESYLDWYWKLAAARRNDVVTKEIITAYVSAPQPTTEAS